MNAHPPIKPREKLSFGLDGDIPRFWFGNNPFKTRFADAMSTSFPEGERYFISCVRDYRDQISDPQLQREVKDFIRQEGQHGIIHDQFNLLLGKQGIDVKALENITSSFLFGFKRKYLPQKYNLACVAAAEHLTAIMATVFFERKNMMGSADPRVYAMYAWHAMEEMEHKAVAFDVMQKVAKVGYFTRVLALMELTFTFVLSILYITNKLLKADGFSLFKRIGLFTKGMWWLYGPGGLFSSSVRVYASYYKPGFHPWQEDVTSSYRVWLDTFNRTGDVLEAGRMVLDAAA